MSTKRGIKCVSSSGAHGVFNRYTVMRISMDTTHAPSSADWPDYLVDTCGPGIAAVNAAPYSRYGTVSAFETKTKATEYAKREQARCAPNERMLVQKITHIVKPCKRTKAGSDGAVVVGESTAKKYKYMVSVLSSDDVGSANVKETRMKFAPPADDIDEDDEEDDEFDTYYAAKNKSDGPFLAETENEAKLIAKNYAKHDVSKLVVYSRIADIETGEEDEVREI